MDTIYIFVSVIGLILSPKDICGDDKEMAMNMLKKYQYMGENSPDPEMISDEMFGEALMNFQIFVGLNETGQLDNETMTKLMSPRCGVPDVIDKGSMMRRKKRYALDGTKWSGTIAYNFKSFAKNSIIDDSVIKEEVKRAMDEWSKYANVNFAEKAGTVNIEISFERGEHGDNYKFDGPGMTLAHAFFPGRGTGGRSDLHFDDDETWATGGRDGKDLYYVALHELGHTLGLQHSPVEEAVMFPHYPGYVKDLKLEPDDIAGMRAIYGKRHDGEQPSTTRPLMTVTPVSGTQALREQFCAVGTIDAIGSLNGKLFAFQGEMYAELDEQGIKPGFPRNISDDWKDLSHNLDAALGLTNPVDRTQMLLLFKGQLYWRFVWDSNDRPSLVEGYPREIKNDFVGRLPSSVDAAFTWSDNGRIYIVEGNQYYRIRKRIKVSKSFMKVKSGIVYPRDFRGSWNILGNISDILMYEGRTFFFKENKYLRYNDNTYKPDKTNDDMRTASAWFGCRSPGSLRAPDMEMDMMKEHSHFIEVAASIINAATSTIGSWQMLLPIFVHIMFIKM